MIREGTKVGLSITKYTKVTSSPVVVYLEVTSTSFGLEHSDKPATADNAERLKETGVPSFYSDKCPSSPEVIRTNSYRILIYPKAEF